jgi:hypothetical protein
MRPASSIMAVVLPLLCLANSATAEMTASQMQNAIERHMCPAAAQEVSDLDYSSCGPQPSGASRTYLDCQNHIDAENRLISQYNGLIRDCRASDARRASSPSSGQSELARAKEAAKNKAEGSDAANIAAEQQLPGLTRDKAAADQAEQAAESQRRIDAANARRDSCQMVRQASDGLLAAFCCGSHDSCINTCGPRPRPPGRTCREECNGGGESDYDARILARGNCFYRQ